MAQSGNGTAVTSVEAEVMNESADPRPSTVVVRNRAASSDPVVARVPALHGATGGATVWPGETVPLRVNNSGIDKLLLKTASGTATVDWWVGAVTR